MHRRSERTGRRWDLGRWGGLPVVVFAVLLVMGAQWIGRAFSVLTKIERVARPITGAVFNLADLYLAATHIFGLNL
jgi:hypothetical protein